jgi:hypothetical protein
MATKKGSKKRTTETRKSGAEYRFKIDAYSPATIPMARLAEYMAQLAILIGETPSVHFLRLETGSTVLVHQIEKEAIPKVQDRAIAVRRGDAPRDAHIAYKTMNRMLRDDNATAVLTERKRGPVLLAFPGKDLAEIALPTITQHGSIEGLIMRVGGTDETIPVLLESEGNQIAGCYTNRAIAKELAKHLFDPARLHGQGRWTRDADGVWGLKSFRIESYELLKSDSLSEVLTELRAVGGEWGDSSLDELNKFRHGRS